MPNTLETIGVSCFQECENLVYASVPFLSENMFDRCINLQEVEFTGEFTKVNGGAFDNCEALQEITLPNSVEIIGDSAFQKCTSLKSINIPTPLTTIESYAFCDCNGLTELTIPSHVTTMGSAAFGNCNNLTINVYFTQDNLPSDWANDWADGVKQINYAQ